MSEECKRRLRNNLILAGLMLTAILLLSRCTVYVESCPKTPEIWTPPLPTHYEPPPPAHPAYRCRWVFPRGVAVLDCRPHWKRHRI